MNAHATEELAPKGKMLGYRWVIFLDDNKVYVCISCISSVPAVSVLKQLYFEWIHENNMIKTTDFEDED